LAKVRFVAHREQGMSQIEAIHQDTERYPEAVLCMVDDGRVFVTLANSLLAFVQEEDEDHFPAVQRAWTVAPHLFNGPLTPRSAPVVQPEGAGMARDMPAADLAKLDAIIDKWWPWFFAEEPDRRQRDNLIDAWGAKAATALVKRTVDARQH